MSSRFTTRSNFPFGSLHLQRPRVVWKDEEIKILLKAWKDHLYTKDHLKRGASKAALFHAISIELQKCGYRRSTKEIHIKTENLGRNLRNAKKELEKFGKTNFKFFDEVTEVLQIQDRLFEGVKSTTEPQIVHLTDQPDYVFEEAYVETVPSENSSNVQVISLTAPESQEVTNSNPPSYTVISHAEPEVRKEPEVIQITVPHTSSKNSVKESNPLTEKIFLDFFQEFKRSNHQLEKNDASMLELFKEQNDIFRTQTTLLMKLLMK